MKTCVNKSSDNTTKYPTQVVSVKDIKQARKVLQDFRQNLTYDAPKINAKDVAHLSKVRVEQDGEEIQELVAAAWQADWDTVFLILQSNPCIINCIPYNRSWGVLHQAAWFNNLEVTQNLLEIPTCDPFIRTKQDRNNHAEPSSTADTITEDVRIENIIIDAQEKKKEKLKAMEVPSFIEAEYETDIIIHSVLLTIASFRNCIYPEIIESDASLVYSQIMYDVFEYIDTEDQWKTARKCIGHQLQVLGAEVANYFVTGERNNGDINSDNMEEKDDFYGRIIKMYTNTCLSIPTDDIHSKDSKLFHNCLNRNLRTEGIVAKPTLGEDLAYAAFGILLNAILINWSGLKKINKGVTYRGLVLETKEIEFYKENTQFVWISFSSTSKNLELAKFFDGNVLFEIENLNGKYSGVDLGVISDDEEEEILFPSGAKFEVKKVETLPQMTKISIRLIDYKIQTSQNIQIVN